MQNLSFNYTIEQFFLFLSSLLRSWNTQESESILSLHTRAADLWLDYVHVAPLAWEVSDSSEICFLCSPNFCTCVWNAYGDMEHINALLFIKQLSLVRSEEAMATLQSDNLLELIHCIFCTLCVGCRLWGARRFVLFPPFPTPAFWRNEERSLKWNLILWD